MPYKFETNKLKIPRDKDKRIKLTLEDKENIKKMYKTGEYSQRKLANIFGVSRRLIAFYLDNSKLEKAKENFKRRQSNGTYYSKEKQRIYIERLRKHKKELYEKGELI
jgi:DNA-binding XRE family transcriptional regulator